MSWWKESTLLALLNKLESCSGSGSLLVSENVDAFKGNQSSQAAITREGRYLMLEAYFKICKSSLLTQITTKLLFPQQNNEQYSSVRIWFKSFFVCLLSSGLFSMSGDQQHFISLPDNKLYSPKRHNSPGRTNRFFGPVQT